MFFQTPIYFFACKRNPPNRFLISLKPVWKVFEKGLTEVPLLSIFGKVLTLEWPKMRWYEIQWDNMSLFFNSVPFRAVVKPNWKRGPKGPKWCFPNGWMDALQMVLSFQSARHSLQETVQNGKFQPAFPSRLLSSCTFSFPVSSFHFERLTTLTRGAWNRPVLSLKPWSSDNHPLPAHDPFYLVNCHFYFIMSTSSPLFSFPFPSFLLKQLEYPD